MMLTRKRRAGAALSATTPTHKTRAVSVLSYDVNTQDMHFLSLFGNGVNAQKNVRFFEYPPNLMIYYVDYNV